MLRTGSPNTWIHWITHFHAYFQKNEPPKLHQKVMWSHGLSAFRHEASHLVQRGEKTRSNSASFGEISKKRPSKFLEWAHQFPSNARSRKEQERSPIDGCCKWQNRKIFQTPPTLLSGFRRQINLSVSAYLFLRAHSHQIAPYLSWLVGCTRALFKPFGYKFPLPLFPCSKI